MELYLYIVIEYKSYFDIQFDLYFIKICCMATRGKPVSKGPAKKKIERPGLTEDEIEELR